VGIRREEYVQLESQASSVENRQDKKREGTTVKKQKRFETKKESRSEVRKFKPRATTVSPENRAKSAKRKGVSALGVIRGKVNGSLGQRRGVRRACGDGGVRSRGIASVCQ